MKKTDVQMHRDGYGPGNPAINVKVYNFPVCASDVALKFGCDEATAQRALDFAFESAAEIFWEQAKDAAEDIFGARVEVYSEGRSGGWLVLHNLPDVESWDALELGKYARMVKHCRDAIDYLSSSEALLEDIEANQWHKAGAERYNFVDTNGQTQCIADLKSAAIAAGFAPVVRK